MNKFAGFDNSSHYPKLEQQLTCWTIEAAYTNFMAYCYTEQYYKLIGSICFL